jgi:NhaP-type Na+/H+ or K+/H+ antiporter
MVLLSNMSSYTILTILICLSAFFAYVNHRFIRMPFVIGLFFLSTILSLVILSSKLWLPIPYSQLKAIVEQADISKYILDIMLGFLLFAGSLHTSWSDIRQQWRQVTLLAVGGVLVSTVIIGSLFYGVTVLLHMEIDIIYCFLFGALISPTDPIAVIGILTKANVFIQRRRRCRHLRRTAGDSARRWWQLQCVTLRYALLPGGCGRHLIRTRAWIDTSLHHAVDRSL